MQPRTRASLLKAWYRLWAVIAAITILVAILFSAARLLFPLVPGYKQELESLAGNALNRQVTIEEITTDWKLFRPRIKLINVRVLAGENEPPLLQLEQVILGIDLLDSILQRTPDIDDITLLGSTVNLVRNQTGMITAQGVSLYSPSTEQKEIKISVPPALQNRVIKLVDINIDYVDKGLGLHYYAPATDMVLDLESNNAALYLDIALPEALGERMEIAVETYGAIDNPNDLSGRIYIHGTGLLPANWQQPVWVSDRFRSGQFDVSLWINIRQPKKIELAGKLNGDDLSIILPETSRRPEHQWQAEKLQLDFHARADKDSIRFNMGNLLVKRAGKEWPISSIELRTPRDREQRFVKGELGISFVRIEDFFPILAAFAPGFATLEQAGLKAAGGDIENIYLNWDLSADKEWASLQADLHALHIEGQGRVPSVKGINGKLRINDSVAAINFNTDELEFDYPRLFRAPLPLASINGELQIHHAEQALTFSARDIHIKNIDADSISWFDYKFDLDTRSLLVNHYSRFEVFNAESTPRYLPANIMKSKQGLRWLDNAFISGGARNGEFTFNGPVKEMPFRNNEGVFRIEFDTVDNVLNIWEPGPYATDIVAHAVFDGPSLNIFGYSAKVLDSRAQDIGVQIDDMQKTDLIINARLYGSAKDALDYIKQSNVRRVFAKVVDQLAVSGMQAMELDLNIPLHNSKLEPGDRKPVRFGIDGNLHEVAIGFSDWQLNFTGLQSNVQINERSVIADTFTGLLNDQPVAIQIDTQDVDSVSTASVNLSGNIRLKDFLHSINQPFAQFVDGQSIVQAELELDLSGGNANEKHNPLLRVTSDLQGTGIQLPEPLSKPRKKKSSLLLITQFKESASDSYFSYANRVHGKIRKEYSGEQSGITHAAIKLNSGVPVLRGEPGIFIDGYVPMINLDQWRDLRWVQQSGQGVADKIRLLEVEAGKFIYLNRIVENMDVGLERSQHNWRINLDSEVLRGEVLVPTGGFEKRGLSINLEYADYDRIIHIESAEQPLPSDLPPFRLKIDKLKFNNWDLNEFSMLADVKDEVVKIHSIRIEESVVGLNGAGKWSVDGDGKHLTEVQLKFNSKNVGEGLARFNFKKLIDRGIGSADFNLYWQAPPSSFELGILQGDARINIENGQILELDPGTGRILGLLNLQSIPRRLSMDFRDLFQEGYVFDKMKGDFIFSDGHAYTSNYLIDGPVGRIDIKGRTGLVAQDYDQQVKFRPELSNSLPVIGALLGGSTGGWAMVVMDRMTKLFGGDTDELGQAQYTVTGPWSNPVITPVKKSRRETINNRKSKTKNGKQSPAGRAIAE